MTIVQCDNCDDERGEIKCTQCDEVYCKSCDEALHKPQKMRAHKRVSVGVVSSSASLSSLSSISSANSTDDDDSVSVVSKSPTKTVARTQSVPPSSSPSSRPLTPRLKSMPNKPSHSAPSASENTSGGGTGGMTEECENCEEAPAVVHCPQCDMKLCNSCSTDMHKPLKMKSHNVKAFVASRPPSPSLPPPLKTRSSGGTSTGASQECENCEDEAATLSCDECDMKLCASCNTALHAPQRMQLHQRRKLNGDILPKTISRSATPPPVVRRRKSAGGVSRHTRHVSLMGHRDAAKITRQLHVPTTTRPSSSGKPSVSAPSTECENCEESNATVSCEQCEMKLCGECDGALHQPQKMRSHNRTSLKGEVAPRRHIRAKSHIIPRTGVGLHTRRISVMSPSGGVRTPSPQPSISSQRRPSIVSQRRPSAYHHGRTLSNLTVPSPKTSPPRRRPSIESSGRVEECSNCEDAIATVRCLDEGAYYCGECDADIHKPLKSAGHRRVPVGGSGGGGGGNDASSSPKTFFPSPQPSPQHPSSTSPPTPQSPYPYFMPYAMYPPPSPSPSQMLMAPPVVAPSSSSDDELLKKFRGILDESNKELTSRLSALESTVAEVTPSPAAKSTPIMSPSGTSRSRRHSYKSKRASLVHSIFSGSASSQSNSNSNNNNAAAGGGGGGGSSGSTDNRGGTTAIVDTLDKISRDLDDERAYRHRLEEKLNALSSPSTPPPPKRRSTVRARRSILESMKESVSRGAADTESEVTMQLSRQLIQSMLEKTLHQAMDSKSLEMSSPERRPSPPSTPKAFTKLRTSYAKEPKVVPPKRHRSRSTRKKRSHSHAGESDSPSSTARSRSSSTSSHSTSSTSSAMDRVRRAVRKDAKAIRRNIVKHSVAKKRASKRRTSKKRRKSRTPTTVDRRSNGTKQDMFIMVNRFQPPSPPNTLHHQQQQQQQYTQHGHRALTEREARLISKFNRVSASRVATRSPVSLYNVRQTELESRTFSSRQKTSPPLYTFLTRPTIQ